MRSRGSVTRLCLGGGLGFADNEFSKQEAEPSCRRRGEPAFGCSSQLRAMLAARQRPDQLLAKRRFFHGWSQTGGRAIFRSETGLQFRRSLRFDELGSDLDGDQRTQSIL